MQALRGDVETFVLVAPIEPQTFFHVRQALKSRPNAEEIDVLLFSGGGSPDDAYHLVKAFQSKYNKVNIVIPYWAKSAATLIALGATNIVMHEFGELGPIDAQVLAPAQHEDAAPARSSALTVTVSLAEIEERSRQFFLKSMQDCVKAGGFGLSSKQLNEHLLAHSAEFYAPLLSKIDTYQIGEMARALEVGRAYALKILSTYGKPPKTKESLDTFLDYLVTGCPDHGFVIDYGLVSRYLPNVVKAEKAFGSGYDLLLNEVSIHLIPFVYGFESTIGFISDIHQVNLNDEEKKESELKSDVNETGKHSIQQQ